MSNLARSNRKDRYVSKRVSVLTRTAVCPSVEGGFYPPDEEACPDWQADGGWFALRPGLAAAFLPSSARIAQAAIAATAFVSQ